MLTGLLNRRAYDNACKMLIGNCQVGVIFCDVNSLKYTNDNFGHEAGDKLINSYPIASVGDSYGNAEKLIDLIASAENKMYVDKADFHQKYPQYSRKN